MEDTLEVQNLPEIVLQCAGCKTIVGDTRDFLCTYNSSEGCRLVVLKAATDVTLGQDGQHKTKYGILTYRTIACANCGSHLGRAHVGNIPDQLEQLHHAFAFDIEQCKSYLFGTSDLRIEEDELTTSCRLVTRERTEADTPLVRGEGEGEGEEGGGGGGGREDHVAALLGKIHELEEELLKIQGVLVLHDQQLKQLPGYPGNQ